MDFQGLIKNGSCAFYSQDDFLARIHNQFDSGIRTVVFGVTDRERVEAKINDFFGAAERTFTDGTFVIEPVTLFEKTRFNFSDLVEIICRLRDPDGCPWDRAQTNKSIRTNIIEEAYELVEAVDADSVEKMREESGDVLLQSVFSAVMADEAHKFSVNDMLTELCNKLISRHTHIFGRDKASSPEEALKFWEKAKAKEKKQASVEDKVDSIPQTFNALLYANKLQKYIKRTGFDFPDLNGAIDKLYEEIREFVEAGEDTRESEGGDILFSAVNVLRMCDIDPEVALNGTSNRFKKRFYYVIEQAKKQGKSVEELTFEEMEAFYNESKKHE